METKNNGKNIIYENGVKREDKTDKIRYDLIPTEMLTRLAGLYTRGAKIYGDRNMESGNLEYAETCKQSAWRHFIQWIEGKQDEDHAMALTWNIFTYEFLIKKLGEQKQNTRKELDFYIQFIEGTDEEYLNYMKKTYSIDVEGVNDTLFGAYISAYKNNKDYCIVWCSVIDYNTIAHEVSHAILDIMKAKEITYSEESKEIFANYLGYWIERGILFFMKDSKI